METGQASPRLLRALRPRKTHPHGSDRGGRSVENCRRGIRYTPTRKTRALPEHQERAARARAHKTRHARAPELLVCTVYSSLEGGMRCALLPLNEPMVPRVGVWLYCRGRGRAPRRHPDLRGPAELHSGTCQKAFPRPLLAPKGWALLLARAFRLDDRETCMYCTRLWWRVRWRVQPL
jgi:hypothetical protein